MMSAAVVDRMQLLAFNSTNALYFDNAETENFYLYDKVAKTIQTLTASDARTWFNTNATWTLPGTTCWGYIGLGVVANNGVMNAN
jgi:hypothetical protein